VAADKVKKLMAEKEDPGNRDLMAETRRVQAEFIQAELETGLTFAALAQTESDMGDAGHFRQCVEGALKAYREVERRLPSIKTSDMDRQSIISLCEKLKQALSALGVAI
jgi:hypothetical protein